MILRPADPTVALISHHLILGTGQARAFAYFFGACFPKGGRCKKKMRALRLVGQKRHEYVNWQGMLATGLIEGPVWIPGLRLNARNGPGSDSSHGTVRALKACFELQRNLNEGSMMGKARPARDVLVAGEMPDPIRAAGEVRIRIAASGINLGDIKKRENAFCYGMPYPRVIPHGDGAGRVDQVSSGVSSEWVGRSVWCYGAQSIVRLVRRRGLQWFRSSASPCHRGAMHQCVFHHRRVSTCDSITSLYSNPMTF